MAMKSNNNILVLSKKHIVVDGFIFNATLAYNPPIKVVKSNTGKNEFKIAEGIIRIIISEPLFVTTSQVSDEVVSVNSDIKSVSSQNQNDGESVNDDVYASQSCSFGTNLDVKPATSSIKQEELVDSDLSKIDREVRLTIPRFIPIKQQTRYKIIPSIHSIELTEPSPTSSQTEYDVLPLDSDMSNESSNSEKILSLHGDLDEKGHEIRETPTDSAGFKVENPNESASLDTNVNNPLAGTSKVHLDIKSDTSSIKQEESKGSDIGQINRELRVTIQVTDKSEIVKSLKSKANDGKNMISEPRVEPSYESDTDSYTSTTIPGITSTDDTNLSAAESEIEEDSKSTKTDGNSIISEISGDRMSNVDTESNTGSSTKKTTEKQGQHTSRVGSSYGQAEDYARKLILKTNAKDPSFGVDKNGVPLTEEQMAENRIQCGNAEMSSIQATSDEGPKSNYNVPSQAESPGTNTEAVENVPLIQTDQDTYSQPLENDGTDTTQDCSLEAALVAKNARRKKYSDLSEFEQLVRNPSATESEMEVDSQSTGNEGNSLISEVSGDTASAVNTESASTSATRKSAKHRSSRRIPIGSSFNSAEEYARYTIAKHAKDPSFGVDANGVPLSEDEMAAKINEQVFL
ncbi:hypothetical protein RF11_09734 [Thelohanellus kitauei]|uniref:Uncharacterized protein n=1 Tax=Thelohanellus kitauei TaxID=669202 RepID=A0A0C2MYR0_THEKT|nr:hypothetical protein RF11_09734 [Thelohanellus kitauei]